MSWHQLLLSAENLVKITGLESVGVVYIARHFLSSSIMISYENDGLQRKKKEKKCSAKIIKAITTLLSKNRKNQCHLLKADRDQGSITNLPAWWNLKAVGINLLLNQQILSCRGLSSLRWAVCRISRSDKCVGFQLYPSAC